VGFHCHDNGLTLCQDSTYPVAQQDHVLVRGKSVRTHRVLNSRNALPSPDFSDIHLLEAEQAFTVFGARHLELLQEYKVSVIMTSQCKRSGTDTAHAKLINGHLYITPTISDSALP